MNDPITALIAELEVDAQTACSQYRVHISPHYEGRCGVCGEMDWRHRAKAAASALRAVPPQQERSKFKDLDALVTHYGSWLPESDVRALFSALRGVQQDEKLTKLLTDLFEWLGPSVFTTGDLRKGVPEMIQFRERIRELQPSTQRTKSFPTLTCGHLADNSVVWCKYCRTHRTLVPSGGH